MLGPGQRGKGEGIILLALASDLSMLVGLAASVYVQSVCLSGPTLLPSFKNRIGTSCSLWSSESILYPESLGFSHRLSSMWEHAILPTVHPCIYPTIEIHCWLGGISGTKTLPSGALVHEWVSEVDPTVSCMRRQNADLGVATQSFLESHLS